MLRALAIGVGGLVALLLVAALGLWLYWRAADIPYATLEARYGDAASRYADLGQGVRLHWREQGRAGGRAVVLVHGFGDNSFSWDRWAAVLGDRYRVYALDMPGHGLTQAPANFSASPENFADLIDRWAAQAGVARFAIAGNSMGGGIAWQLVLRHPARVSRLILVDAAGWPSETLKTPPLAFRLMRTGLGRRVIESIDSTPLIRSSLRGEVGDPAVITPALVERWAAVQRAPGHRRILMSIRPGATAASNEALAAIRVPTLILWGALDPLIERPAADKFHRAIAGSQLIVYPGIGHLPHIENPEAPAADAGRFLDRHPGSGRPGS